MQSETIGALAAALSKAQADITGALKDSSNPFFKSKYADLASCWDACRKQLAANGLSVIQTTQMTEQGLMLVTTLAHASSEWIAGQMPVSTWCVSAGVTKLPSLASVCWPIIPLSQGCSSSGIPQRSRWLHGWMKPDGRYLWQLSILAKEWPLTLPTPSAVAIVSFTIR